LQVVLAALTYSFAISFGILSIASILQRSNK
jgi:hypothetical protein